MATYRFVANDIRTSLKQMYDDADISLVLVIYWMHVFGDRLKMLHIGKYSSGAFLSRFTAVPVERDDPDPYPFITLPQRIYDYDKDKGIGYITYDSSISVGGEPVLGSVEFQRTYPSALKFLYSREEERPSPDNPYFYRVGDKVYLVGVERVNLLSVDLGLFTTFDPTIFSSPTFSIDNTFDFPEHLLPLLRREILEMGRFVLLIPDNVNNDGSGQVNPGEVPSSRILQQPVSTGQPVEGNVNGV
jgi:hypothetical protein